MCNFISSQIANIKLFLNHFTLSILSNREYLPYINHDRPFPLFLSMLYIDFNSVSSNHFTPFSFLFGLTTN